MELQASAIQGFYDYQSQFFITRPNDGDKGYEIVTPLYTKTDADGNFEGVFVNRGWVSEEQCAIFDLER
eukprot:CAMPEP_0170559748 /NCGR_PEP_ID=MMETSP0211-20121228/44765_1 /TAXON_ID=311385 /ORGANISM="Pseudokeronopsis sp., Strain OXSARD2" /LENGTH=68 /DNA_ID=CAMNT_0010873161 /DNA_START=88 /DNA_END=295 /DNA_ORIENTATION=-